jgi:hypothetical protein
MGGRQQIVVQKGRERKKTGMPSNGRGVLVSTAETLS